MALGSDFDPATYYSLAEELVTSRPGSEAKLRTGINRYYVACYLVTLVRLMRGGWKPSSRGESQYAEVEHVLGRRNRRNLQRQLHTLRTYRVHSDYHRYSRPDETNEECDICLSRQEKNLHTAVDDQVALDVRAIADGIYPSLSSL
jgi:hypothetical protein